MESVMLEFIGKMWKEDRSWEKTARKHRHNKGGYPPWSPSTHCEQCCPWHGDGFAWTQHRGLHQSHKPWVPSVITVCRASGVWGAFGQTDTP